MKNYLSVIIIIFLACAYSYGNELHVDKSKSNLVKFISDAPIEDFEGVTNNIDGYLYWEGEDLLNQSKFYFEVDLNTIDTGIGLRNRHMRENYLETEKFPMAVYEGKLSSIEKVNEQEYKFFAEGIMNIHGRQKSLNLNGSLIKSGENYRIKSEFQVSLPDYDIEVPSLMFLKISEVMQLVVDFYLVVINK